MVRTILLFSLFCYSLVYSSTSFASLTNLADGVFYHERIGGGFSEVTDQGRIYLNFGIIDGPEPPSLLFEDYIFTIDDVGKTFTATESTDADFSKVSDFLTNGDNDEIEVGFSHNGGGSSVYSESFALFGNSRIDFAGATIKSIDLRIDYLNFTSPGRDPNRDGIWTDYDYAVTVSVNAIPLPSSLIIFTSGLLALIGIVRNKVT